jgi:hypothetical protein
MAFNDSPKVDDKSKLSEESVLFVKSVFSRKNGFIARDEIPDYGVDLDVELIYSEVDASSHKFPVQIKSEKELRIISKGHLEYISIPFKTSRLGYLCRRIPAYGLIVVYDETKEKAYFDYVEEVVPRINTERGNDDWKNQSEVNIHIALNSFNKTSSASIHTKFSIRFADTNEMLRQYGPVFNIPVLSFNAFHAKWNFEEKDQVIRFLSEHGGYLFNLHEYSSIISLLQKLPNHTIASSQQLLFLAIITYSQTGSIIEAGYYLEKSKAVTFPESQADLVKLSELRVKFLKGDIDWFSLEQKYQELLSSVGSEVNRLNIEVNIIYLKLVSSITKDGAVNEAVVELIDELNKKISESSLDEHNKTLLLLFNSENLFNYWSHLGSKDARRLNLQLKLGQDVPIPERIARAKRFIEVILIPQRMVFEVFRKSGEDKIIAAYSSYYIARFFFNLRFNSMLIRFFDEEHGDEALPTQDYIFHLQFAYGAVGLFVDLSILKEAHQALTCVYELQKMFELLYGESIGFKSLNEIEKDLERLENEAGITPFRSIVTEAYYDLERSTSRKGLLTMAESIPDGAELEAAKAFAEAQNLPLECIPNIVEDMKVHKIFERECINKNIELLQWWPKGQSDTERYLHKPVYVLRSKFTGIESKKSSNIFELLDQFAGLIKR